MLNDDERQDMEKFTDQEWQEIERQALEIATSVLWASLSSRQQALIRRYVLKAEPPSLGLVEALAVVEEVHQRLKGEAEEGAGYHCKLIAERLTALAGGGPADTDAEDSCDLCLLNERNVEALQQRLATLERIAEDHATLQEHCAALEERLATLERLARAVVEAQDALRAYLAEQEANDAKP